MAAALAGAYSSHPANSLFGGNWRRFGLVPQSGLLLYVLLAAGWLAADRNNVRTLLRACLGSGGLAALYGIAQYFGWDPFLPSQAYEVGEGTFAIVRPPGTLGHADYFAAWLGIVVFLGLALDRLEQARWLKIAARAGSALAALAIVLSGTRAALLGLVVGAIVLLIARRERMRASHAAFAIAVAACLALFFFAPAGERLRARLHWSIEDARGGARLLLWRDSLRMAEQRPLGGFGLETFATEFPRFESVELARAYPDFYHESPHNMFLDALTSEGILGLLPLLGLCGLGAWAAARGWQSGRPLAAPLGAALAGALVSQQFVVLVFATALYFHLLIALLVADLAPRPEMASAPARGTPAWTLVPLSVIGLLLAGSAVRLVMADRALASTQHHLASSDASGAALAYRSVLRWQPPGAGADLKYSLAMQQLAARTPILAARLVASQQALEAAVHAVSTAEDRQNAWYNLSMLLAGDNDVAGTERSLRNAIACAPNWFKPHWALAQLLELTNRRAEALVEAQAALERDGGRDPEVAETWTRLRSAATASR
jgi:O-antigen ligase